MKKMLFAFMAMFVALSAKAGYSVGDYYEENGVKGIVIKVDATGEHGLIMSLDKFKGKWCSDKKAKFETNAFYEDDGQKNMEAVERFISESGKTWDLFPFFEWCRNKGEGWYAPALDELNALITAVNGSIGTYQASAVSKMESNLTAHGGESLFGAVKFPMGGKMPYSLFSSTEGNKGKIHIVGILPTSPFAAPKVVFWEAKKSFDNNMGSRAVHKF